MKRNGINLMEVIKEKMAQYRKNKKSYEPDCPDNGHMDKMLLEIFDLITDREVEEWAEKKYKNNGEITKGEMI